MQKLDKVEIKMLVFCDIFSLSPVVFCVRTVILLPSFLWRIAGFKLTILALGRTCSSTVDCSAVSSSPYECQLYLVLIVTMANECQFYLVLIVIITNELQFYLVLIVTMTNECQFY